LGTCNTLIYLRGKGIVINEPSVVAVEKGTNRVVAVGAEAKRMLWKTPGDIIAIRPLADGVIADIDNTEKLIRYFISKIMPRSGLFRSIRMKIGIPSCITEVERRAVQEAALKAGAKEVQIIEESLAAAIGAQIPINEPEGHMVCDIGGGTTEVSVISLGGMVVTNAIRLGGDEFDEAIIKYVRNVHNLIIGQQRAERLKIEIGNATPDKNIEKMEVKGTDAITGLPRRLEIDSVEVREALKDPITQIVDEIKRTLGKTPPELAADIFTHGIVMTGGGSMLKGLQKLISKETGVPVLLVDNAIECVAIGAGQAFEVYKDMSNNRSIYDSLNN
jgi:rod shape-determining protein MreB